MTQGHGDGGYDVDDPGTGLRYRFSRAGQVLTIDVYAHPGGGVPDHYHPNLEERWEVLEGEVILRRAGFELVASPGDEIVVPPGVRHSFRNTGTRAALLRAQADPALHSQELLTESAALDAVGRVSRGGIRERLGALLDAVELADRYADTTVLMLPPPAVQRILFPPLARLQRRRHRGATSRGVGS